MDEMIEKGISPNEFTYSVAITACGNGGEWSKALELLDKMKSMGMKVNTITYNAAINALAKAARTESKQKRRYDYDEATESERDADPGALWRRVLGLIEDMKLEGVPLDKFTYSSAINACGAAGRWEEAVDLIREMKVDGNRENKPNKVTYTSAIGEFY
jgi:pentatricopeptide repeat protein